MDKFWMVLVDGTGSTSYKHPTLESAKVEAERLLKDTGRYGATILETTEHVTAKYSVEWDKTVLKQYVNSLDGFNPAITKSQEKLNPIGMSCINVPF